ncbi:hypothetical protein LCGC14_2006870 [marine sediment metagenome]|uniref:Uncharacterized protein n=1 Tax=marine sediment metagenome TaxID=412755 RepID=A0A0F9HYJ3_9ZZZZ
MSIISHKPDISLIAGIDSNENIIPMAVDSEGRIISSTETLIYDNDLDHVFDNSLNFINANE